MDIALPKKSLPKLSILIADGKSANRAALLEKLQSSPGWDIHAVQAGSAHEALASLREHMLDIAFLDCRLPDSDGIKLLEQVRQLYPKVAVIMVSDVGSEKLAVEAMKRGAIDYMSWADLCAEDMGVLLRRAAEMHVLQAENAELRQVNRMKDEFLSSVSHELRTPLAVILGYAKTMEDGELGELSPQQKIALKAIRGRGEHLLHMVNELLSFKESALGAQQLLLRPVELRAYLKEFVAAHWKKKKISLELVQSIPDESAWVLSDPKHLGEVLESLLSNAVKFSPKGQRVTVGLERRETGEVWIMIQDEGRGIPPEALSRLFEGFFHTDKELTREVPGLGLGLALARQIIDLHGGRIWMESKGVDKGSTAFIALPVAEPSTPQMLVEQQRKIDKKRVLLVEDNYDIIELLRLFLAGFSQNLLLTTSNNGLEALELMTQNHYDILLLDLMLPGLSGLEVLDRIKKLPKNKRIPILILTGHKGAVRQAMQKGASDFLIKPFDKKAFITKILTLLQIDRRSTPR